MAQDNNLEPPPRDSSAWGPAWMEWLFKFYIWVKTRMGRDWYWDVAAGLVPGFSIIHKFGYNEAVGTSPEPICHGGVYQTPTGTVTLAAISDDTNDTAAGTGAQTLVIEYLDANFVEQTATINMNGTSETTDTVTGVKRINRAYVGQSGTYATTGGFSQNGTITIRVSGAGATWATIPEIGTSGNAVGQSLIGGYTVPAGYTAYLLNTTISVESGKPVTMQLYKRESADDTTTPYSPGRIQLWEIVDGTLEVTHKGYEVYPEKTDIIWMGYVSSTSSQVAVDYELMLVAN